LPRRELHRAQGQRRVGAERELDGGEAVAGDAEAELFARLFPDGGGDGAEGLAVRSSGQGEGREIVPVA